MHQFINNQKTFWFYHNLCEFQKPLFFGIYACNPFNFMMHQIGIRAKICPVVMTIDRGKNNTLNDVVHKRVLNLEGDIV